jgi:hypothetical protein
MIPWILLASIACFIAGLPIVGFSLIVIAVLYAYGYSNI